MVPAIFQMMEQADDSEGFDSCEDEQIDSSKKTGNPFLDFNQEIEDIEDENLASKYLITLI